MTTKPQHIAIVGFGLSGLLVFLNLVTNYKKSSAKKLFIRIFEKSPLAPKGIAYSTNNINHLLNVPACKMGINPQEQDGFYKWLISKGYDYQKNDFVPRKIFGIYLENVLESALKIADEKGIFYEILNRKIFEIELKNKRYVIDGGTYHHCILATGVRFKNWQQNFWNIDLKKYLGEKEIHIVGCGLTAFDAAISLRDLNYSGKIFMYSRSGKMPRVHKEKELKVLNPIEKTLKAPLSLEDTDLPLSLIFKKFVKACKNSTNWQTSFDAIRPMTQAFWKKLSLQKKRRFMRHCLRLWNIHRHRCPESQFAIIQNLLDSGRLFLLCKKPNNLKTINCAGFDYNSKSQLINSLIENGIAEYDDLRAGIIAKKPNFYIMGALNFGTIFEINSVPDIASQALEVAWKILAHLDAS